MIGQDDVTRQRSQYSLIQSWELLHQQRRIQPEDAARKTKSRLLGFLMRTACVLSIISTFLLVLIELADSAFGVNINNLPASAFSIQVVLLYFLPIFILFPTTAILYIRVLIETLSLGIDSIVREKETRAWDVLALSPVGARDLICGKITATLQATFHDYLLLGILRVGVLTWSSLASTRMSLNVFPQYFAEWSVHIEFPPQPQYLLIMCVVLPILTLLSGLFTAIVGVLAGLFLKRPQLWVAWGLRTGVLMTIFTVFSISANLHFQRFAPTNPVLTLSGNIVEVRDKSYEGTVFWTAENVLYYTGLSFLDGGSSVSSTLIGSKPVRIGQHFYLIATLLMVLTIYLALIVFLLWLAIWIARRQGM